jgi:hypothetical protein
LSFQSPGSRGPPPSGLADEFRDQACDGVRSILKAVGP